MSPPRGRSSRSRSPATNGGGKFATAATIPASTPVRFLLQGADVIHSFWIPALAGKTDMIPGQTNETWLEASVPGESDPP
jgi:cytochrome c oxidase subunit II